MVVNTHGPSRPGARPSVVACASLPPSPLPLSLLLTRVGLPFQPSFRLWFLQIPSLPSPTQMANPVRALYATVPTAATAEAAIGAWTRQYRTAFAPLTAPLPPNLHLLTFALRPAGRLAPPALAPPLWGEWGYG